MLLAPSAGRFPTNQRMLSTLDGSLGEYQSQRLWRVHVDLSSLLFCHWDISSMTRKERWAQKKQPVLFAPSPERLERGELNGQVYLCVAPLSAKVGGACSGMQVEKRLR